MRFSSPTKSRSIQTQCFVKKLEDITLDEIKKECPDCLKKSIVKAYQSNDRVSRSRVNSIIKKWQTFYEINYVEIFEILNKTCSLGETRFRDILNDNEKIIGELITDIKNIFLTTYYKTVSLLDILETVSNSPFIDGRKIKKYQKEIESLKTKLSSKEHKTDEREIKKIITYLEKLETKQEILKRQEILPKQNPFISSQAMINYQAMKLFDCIRKYISDSDMNDKRIDSIIADLFNHIYQVSKFDSEMVRQFRKNARSKLKSKK